MDKIEEPPVAAPEQAKEESYAGNNSDKSLDMGIAANFFGGGGIDEMGDFPRVDD